MPKFVKKGTGTPVAKGRLRKRQAPRRQTGTRLASFIKGKKTT